MSETISEPISAQPHPSSSPDPRGKRPLGARLKGRVQHTVEKITTKDGWIGDYDFVWLCAPGLPWGGPKKRSKAPPFYALDADLPILLAIVVGFQHALAMVRVPIVPSDREYGTLLVFGSIGFVVGRSDHSSDYLFFGLGTRWR